MATDASFMTYVCDQVAGAGGVTTRRMFGEYALYCDGKVVALVCDNQCFLKPTAAARALLHSVREGFPFPGAKPWWVIDEELEDAVTASRLVRLTADALPMPKPKSKPKAKADRKPAGGGA